jgi:hypothetical protein
MTCPCQKQIGGQKRKGNRSKRNTKHKKGKSKKHQKSQRRRKMRGGGGLLGDFQTSVLGTSNQLTGSIYTNPATHIQPAGEPYSFGKYLV